MTDWPSRMRPLTADDLPAMMDLQAVMLSALPDPRWYFPSTTEEFAVEVLAGHATGVFDGRRLIAFGIASPGQAHRTASYATRVGDDPADTFDFQDIMVHPDYRRQGIHSAFLARYIAQALAMGCRAVYATVDPDNEPSWRSFEKAGFRRIAVQPAYDGRIRAYYKWTACDDCGAENVRP